MDGCCGQPIDISVLLDDAGRLQAVGAAGPLPNAPVDALIAAAGQSILFSFIFFFSSRRRHTRFDCDWSSDVCSSDLVLHKDALIQLIDTDGGDSRLLALNRKTGETLWTQERRQFRAGWSTPLIWSHDGQDEIVAVGNSRLMAYDPQTGSPRWWVDGFPQETVNSPVAGDGMVFA